MKRVFLFLTIFMMVFCAHAQYGQTYTQYFDSVFINIDKSDALTGILYERVVPFAHLNDFNSAHNPDVDTINASIFKQAYSELYNAAFNPATRLPYNLDSIKKMQMSDTGFVGIGVVYYHYNRIDSSVAVRKLYFDNDSILREDKSISESLFSEDTVFIASPLVNEVYGNTICFRLPSTLFFDNVGQVISSFSIDFGDGFGQRNIKLGDSIQITYPDTGRYIICTRIYFSKNKFLEAYSQIHCRMKMETAVPYPKDVFPIQAKIPFTDYEGGQNLCSTGKMCIYYANNDKILRKPLLVSDGFDPQNTRNFESGSDGKESLWNMLSYEGKHLGDTLISKYGYDLVFLDYSDGGEYIERNAMVCVAALDTLNKILKQNGSEAQIVIVGPSMGGPVTQYALSYIEQNPSANTNFGKHNCRLWVSIDAPLQGANIPLSGQIFAYFFGYAGNNETAKALWDNVLNCSAAKQMLKYQYNIYAPQSVFQTYNQNIIQYVQHPYFTQFYNSLSSLGYPEDLRKISVIDGCLNGITNLQGCTDALKLRIRLTTIRISEMKLMPSLGSCEIFYGMFPTLFDHVLGNRYKMQVNAPAESNYSIDAAPGGRFNTFEMIKEGVNWDSLFIKASLHQPYHNFMPVTSTLDLRGNYNYCTDFSNRDLVSEGITPFDSYKGLMDSSMYHATFNQDMVNYLINEIETYITGPREIRLCTQWPYAIHLPQDSVAEVTWLSSANIRVEPTNNPYVVNIVPLSTGDGWISAEVSTLKHRKALAHYPIHIANNDDLTPIVQGTTIQGQSFVINDERYLTTDTFCVENGKTLTVTGTLHCSSGARIIVRPGGRLVVDGGVLTSACEDGMWEGIYVEGDRTKRQTAANQGTVELKNGAVIENALCGITTCSPDDNMNTNGGIILADNATFRNCRCAVELFPYADLVGTGTIRANRSHFHNCTFTVDDDNNFAANNTDFSTHVRLWGVKGVHFKGCNFSNTATNTSRGRAIYTEDAGFSVETLCEADPSSLTEPCECPSNYAVASTFSGFATAVEAHTTGDQYAVDIDGALFQNNAIGIEIDAVSHASVTRCDFDLQTSPMPLRYSIGLYLNNSTGYLVEENSFHRSSYPNGASVNGIRVSNSGTDDNAIRRNSFSKLNYGVYVQGTNGRFDRPIEGLGFSCNTFTSNGNDIYVSTGATIRPEQGSMAQGADNTFAGSLLYNLYAPARGYRYFHSRGHAPTNCYNFSIQAGASGNDCESTLCHNSGISIATYQDPSVGQSPDNTFELAMSANASIRSIMSDTLEDLSALADWYGIMDGASAKYALAETQWQLGKDNSATLQYIADKYLTSEEEREEYDNYRLFDAIKMANWPEATGEQIDELRRIAEKNSGRSSVMARGVLCFFFGECDENLTSLIDDMGMEGRRTSGMAEVNQVMVYPNPFSDVFSVYSSQLTIRRVELLDIFGKLLFAQAVGGSGCDLDLTAYPAGMYLLKAELEDDSTETMKVVKK